MVHNVVIDYTEGDHIDTAAFCAFCECGWRGDWRHVDEGVMNLSDDGDMIPPFDAEDAAEGEATEDGLVHIRFAD